MLRWPKRPIAHPRQTLSERTVIGSGALPPRMADPWRYCCRTGARDEGGKHACCARLLHVAAQRVGRGPVVVPHGAFPRLGPRRPRRGTSWERPAPQTKPEIRNHNLEFDHSMRGSTQIGCTRICTNKMTLRLMFYYDFNAPLAHNSRPTIHAREIWGKLVKY